MQAPKPSGSGIEASTNIFKAYDEVSFVAARMAGYRLRMCERTCADIGSATAIVQACSSPDCLRPSRQTASFVLEGPDLPSEKHNKPRDTFSLEQA